MALDDTLSPDFESENAETNDLERGPSPWGRLVALDRSNPDIAFFECDMVIGRAHVDGNRKVSKFHCRIVKESSEDVRVTNLSKNGTIINGSVLKNEQPRTLKNGDAITLGPCGSGTPHYIFHLLDNSLDEGNRKADEVLESDIRSDSAKRLKLSKAKYDLICCICLSVWHDVVTVAPCLHSFCNGCFSEWYRNREMSRRGCSCPQCRERIICVKKNHTLSSMIEYYLQEFPSLKRSFEETSYLDQQAMVGNNHMNIGDSDSFTSDEDNDDGGGNVEVARCPQCPRSETPVQDSDAFVCGPDTLHLLCVACSTALPERTNINVPQTCPGCSQVFCGLYWRSQNANRSTPLMAACLMKNLSEDTVTNIPVDAFWGNIYEQEVTRRYLQGRSLQIQDIIAEWFGKMDRDEIEKPDLLPNRPQSPFNGLFFCNRCENAIVNHLLYKFRLSVPKSELPSDAAGRDDCWYGRLCRTQTHNSSHARRYNHVCEPSPRARGGL